MIATFFGASIGMIAGNFVYQFFCAQPDWAVAMDRSYFQLIALIGVGAALAIRSVKA